MPRTARSVLPGVPHHIILRGNNRRRLFSYPRDYNDFLFLTGRQLETGDVALNASCLMSNHVHLLVTPEEASALSRFVKGVAQRYAQCRNRRLRASGKLFEERYYSKAMQSEAHLALTTAYIDLNPVRAGMTKTGQCYRWSTFSTHAGSTAASPYADLWSPSSWYLGLANDSAGRAAAYLTWTAQRLALDEWKGVRSDPTAHVGPPVRRPNRTRAAG
jgi:putative transposase